MDTTQQSHASAMPPPRRGAFERWLEAELARRYGLALAEPVPESLLRLVGDRAGGWRESN